jgi:hypothetical protein
MSDNKDPTTKAADILESLKKGKSVYDVFSADFRTRYLIAGKTLAEWESKFKIKIPEQANPHECKNLDTKLMELHQEATFNLASSKAVMQALKRGIDTEMNSRKTALVQQYTNNKAKLPAAATLESMARSQIDDVDGAMMSALIASNFWQDLIDHISFCRKLLENITINNGIEGKMGKSLG